MSKIFQSLLKCFVSPISITIGTAGIGMLVLGFVGATALNSFMPTIMNVLKTIYPGNITQLQSSIQTSVDPIFEISKYLGGVVMFVGFFGAAAACLGNSTLLRVYGILAILVSGVLAIVLYQITSGSATESIKGTLKNSIRDKYADFIAVDPYSIIWNAFMLLFRCCGVDNFGDFNNTVLWNRTFYQNISGYEISIYQISPIACCKNNATSALPALPDLTSLAGLMSLPTALPKLLQSINPEFFIDFLMNLEPECAEEPSQTNSNYLTGCWALTTSKLSTFTTILLYVLYALVAAPIVVGVIAIGASCKSDPKKT